MGPGSAVETTAAEPPMLAADGEGDEPACKPGSVDLPEQAATIHLGLPLPTASCGLPAGSDGQSSSACAGPAPKCRPLLALLRVGFTEPPQSPGVLVVSYTAVSPLPGCEQPGGLFSVALSRGSPRVGVTHHRALWSPDFPRPPFRVTAIA